MNAADRRKLQKGREYVRTLFNVRPCSPKEPIGVGEADRSSLTTKPVLPITTDEAMLT